MDTIYMMESTIKNNSQFTDLGGRVNSKGLREYGEYKWGQTIGGEKFDLTATLFCPSAHSFYSDMRRWRIVGANHSDPAQNFEFTMDPNTVVALSVTDDGEIWAVGDSPSFRLWKRQ